MSAEWFISPSPYPLFLISLSPLSIYYLPPTICHLLPAIYSTKLRPLISANITSSGTASLLK
jgi:hypothetical protein